MSQDVQACRQHLDRFFRHYPDPLREQQAAKVLMFLAAFGEPLPGKPEGWAGGIIYALANRYRQAFGVPGFLNAEFEQFLGVSMDTVHKRAAQVLRAITI